MQYDYYEFMADCRTGLAKVIFNPNPKDDQIIMAAPDEKIDGQYKIKRWGYLYANKKVFMAIPDLPFNFKLHALLDWLADKAHADIQVMADQAIGKIYGQ